MEQSDNILDNLNNLKFSSNFQYRNYLTKNGNRIINMDNNNSIAGQLCNCNYYYVQSTPLPNSQPFLYNSISEKDRPYGYTESDLKTDFINRRLQQYAQDDFRIINAIEYQYNVPYTSLTTKNINSQN